MDNDVQVASASGAASAAIVKGNVTAQGFGADFNLAAGTFFSVGNYSTTDLQAKNDSDFSGGSSQDVVAVAKDDADSLKTDLIVQLTGQGKDNLKSNLSRDNLLVENTVNISPTSADYDHQVGDQAATVKLRLTAKVTALSVSRKNIDDLARQLFQSQVPSGYILNDDQIDFVFGQNDTDFMINLLPVVKPDDLANKISGMTETEAKKYLSRVPGFVDAQIKVTPGILALHFLPHLAKNISISLSGK